MDKVFLEEQKKLAEIESKIDSIASRYETKANDLQRELADYYCVDYEDVRRKQELINERTYAIQLAKQFRDYQPSPYFGRLDLDAEDADESTVYYIGKDGISDSANIIVTDWRSPIGSCYYAANQREFCVNGSKYSLALRRALAIENGTLVSCHTEYDGESVSLEGDVIDPFLLTVLKDKRRHNRLTDIIRTIQGNQNEIIRKSRFENFVVQGCAGSGKTMILLHRLSFLKFNNRKMPLGGVKIITPNKFFDAHINDLSVELGLADIERYSVEEYYVSLIKRYSSKITADSDVQSEKVLNVDLLTELYSIQYLNDAISHYHQYWEQVLGVIDETRLKQYFDNLKIAYPNAAVHTIDTASQFEQGMRRILSVLAEAEKKEKSVLSRLSSIDEDIAAVQKEYDNAISNLENTKNQTISRINAEIEDLSEKTKEREESITAIRRQSEDIAGQRKQLEASNERYSSVLRMFSQGVDIYSQYDSFVRLNDAGSSFLRTICNQIITSIAEAEKAYEETPVYNFGKRNSLRKTIAESKERFAIEVTRIVSNQVHEAQTRQVAIHDAINELNEKLSELAGNIRAEDKELRVMHSRVSALKECVALFSSMDMPDVRMGLLPAIHKTCFDILSAYEEQRSIVNRISARLNSCKQAKEDLENEQQELIKSRYSTEERDYIAECNKHIKKLQFSEITRNVMFRDLLAKYRNHNQKYQKTNYRHKLYLKLLYCTLYFARPFNPDNFLNIDEAQDISISEYHLLRMVLGDKCVFNLYGDINQSVYSYKGIMDWEEISDITSGNIYVLNENYRNTLQITDFCNKEFGAEVYPIGVSGEPVLEMDTENAVKWLLDVKKENPDFRVAVIHRHGLKAVQEKLHSVLTEQDVSWYSVDDKKLSVLSVETAKGLEFEAVVAIVDQMSNNEKYISYTRALDCLTVVRDEYSNELDVDNSVEEIDDEFIEMEDSGFANDDYRQVSSNLIAVLKSVLDIKSSRENESSTNAQFHTASETVTNSSPDRFFSWELLNEVTAVKTCDATFFLHNESGIPKGIYGFFGVDSMQPGDTKTIKLYFEEIGCDAKFIYGKNNRMRILWNADVGEALSQYRDVDTPKAVFSKIDNVSYRITIIDSNNDITGLLRRPDEVTVSDEENAAIEKKINTSTEALVYSAEEYALLAEFDDILEKRFGSGHKLPISQQQIIVELYRGKSVACNAPSGSMKNVMLYLLALKEHQKSGKQTLLTAEAHLQENELVIADKLGLRGGTISTMSEFLADFKKEKYDVIFVPYDFFKEPKNVAQFNDYFEGRISYWGIDHPTSAQDSWEQLNACGTDLDAVMFLMEKSGFANLDLSNYQRIDIIGTVDMSIVKNHTLLSVEEKLKWLLENIDELHGQGLIYCDNESTCKMLGKHLRKAKIMAEAYIDVTNLDKRERINYLTNSFVSGGIPVLITTQEAGKNLSNHNIRFIVHYDMPIDEKLYQLHVSQIGQLVSDAVVHNLRVI